MKARSFVWSLVLLLGLVLLFAGERLVGGNASRAIGVGVVLFLGIAAAGLQALVTRGQLGRRGFAWAASVVGSIAVVALALAFVLPVAEGSFGVASARATASGLGALFVGVALLMRALRTLKAAGERRRIERLLFGFAALIVASLLLYVLQSDLWAQLTGAGLEKAAPKLDGALAALWPAVLALGLLPTFLAELAYASMQRAPQVEANRVRDAALSGVGMASLLVFAFSAYYVAAERDVTADLSYFRTTRPGEATRGLVRTLDTEVEVAAFFPPGNEVREHLAEYLGDLAKESPKLAVKYYDHALDPKLARELGVSGNGTVVVKRGDRKELMGMGLELERARAQLRTLDQDFQKRLLQVARARKTIYFTTGHDERSAEKASSVDQRWTIRLVRQLVGDLNYEVRNLGPAEGLGSEVPGDAGALVIIGPTKPFLPEELAAVQRYLDRGGRVLLALDPEAKLDFAGLLGGYGLAYRPSALANDVASLARTRQPSDRANIFTSAYSSHPSVTTLGKLGQRAPLLMVSAGFLEHAGTRPDDVKVDFTVRSHPMTWNDGDGNFELNEPAESRRTFELAAAVTRPTQSGAEARLLVVADSDAFTDPVVENAGNAYLALDGIKWLAGEEALVGEVNTEEDKPIQHTRKQDLAWFYSTVFAAPVLVLGAGFVATRRRGRRRRQHSEEAKS